MMHDFFCKRHERGTASDFRRFCVDRGRNHSDNRIYAQEVASHRSCDRVSVVVSIICTMTLSAKL